MGCRTDREIKQAKKKLLDNIRKSVKFILIQSHAILETIEKEQTDEHN